MGWLDCIGKSEDRDKREKAENSLIHTDATREPDERRSGRKKPEVIKSRPTDEETYKSSNQNIGIAVILNHEKVKGQKVRRGTEKDRDDFHKTLLMFGFDVRVFDDLSFEEVDNQLTKISQEDHTNNDCFLLAVMSHGLEGKVFASDMPYPVERLWKHFLGDECKSLINKPKLFFIQACRGENLDKPAVFTEFATMSREFGPGEVKPEKITYAIPSTADILVMYSTFEKYYSFRNSELGSWFIQALCKVFQNAAESEEAAEQGIDLLRLLTAVNREVAYGYQSETENEVTNQMKEMPNFMSTLTKTFYLRLRKTTSTNND